MSDTDGDGDEVTQCNAHSARDLVGTLRGLAELAGEHSERDKAEAASATHWVARTQCEHMAEWNDGARTAYEHCARMLAEQYGVDMGEDGGE